MAARGETASKDVDLFAKSQASLKRLAARGPVSGQSGPGIVLERYGAKLRRLHGDREEEAILIGAACSEVFTGPRLAKVLRPALDHQKTAIENMEMDKPWEPLAIHTSAGVPRALADFVESLSPHLPWPAAEADCDWFLNLQLEGATAVWAGVEALATLRSHNIVPAASGASKDETCCIGVAENSYHGALTTALGQPALPRWNKAPRTLGQVPYPLPPADAATSQQAQKAYLDQFETFLMEHKEVGICIFEPQWGSSLLGRTWPAALLRNVISLCHGLGRSVLCDEIMCGLGRHGQGESLFLSSAWELNPDGVTFGKAIASGTFPLSGVAIRGGANALLESGQKVVQSHTYAGSSSLAYLTATQVLREVPAWLCNVKKLGELVIEVLGPLQDEKFFHLHGQGLLWGGELLGGSDLQRLKELCQKEGLRRIQRALQALKVCNLGFTWAEGLNLGTVLVAVGDGLVIPKMKEFSVLHKQHPMPYLMLCWAPVEASYALTLFGVFTAVSAPATMPSLNIVLLLASTVIRIAATVVVGAALGYAAWFLIDKRREATLFGHQVFTNQPVEAFLMLLAVALCAYGLGSNTKGRPTLPLFFGCGSLFQPELMVIVTGSTFAMCCERYNSQNLLAQVEQIMGGVWVFAQLILFAMLGSKTSPSIFPTLVTVLPIMAMGLLARFAGVLLSVRATAAQRRTENQGLRQTLADACFCFLSVLPRATIQGALGAVPVNQRFFQDEAREDRSEARHLIFTAARLYIFCMSIVGMFLLNTFGPMLLEASEERPPEEEAFIHDRFASDLEQFDDRGFHFDSHERDENVIHLAELLGQEYDIPASMVMSLLDERSKALSPVRGGLSPIREHRDIDKVQVSSARSDELSDLSPSAKTDPVRSASARFVGLRARFETEPAPRTKWKELQMKRTWSKMDNFALFDSRGPQVEEDHSAVQGGRYRGYTH